MKLLDLFSAYHPDGELLAQAEQLAVKHVDMNVDERRIHVQLQAETYIKRDALLDMEAKISEIYHIHQLALHPQYPPEALSQMDFSDLIQVIKKMAIDEGHRDEITDEFVDRMILKEMKSVKEQVDTCPDERAELKAEYQLRYDIMSEYAPKLMSVDEIKAVLTEKFADVIATKNKGMIMKNVMAELKGKADGKDISKVVEELCRQ